MVAPDGIRTAVAAAPKEALMALLRRKRRTGRHADATLVEGALHEVKAAEETIWHALSAVGSLLSAGDHRSRGRGLHRPARH